MIDFDGRTLGADNLAKELATESYPEMLEAADAGAEIYLDEVKKVLESGTKSGRRYRLPGGRVHRASAPGEPPAKLTGQLIRALGRQPADRKGNLATSFFGVGGGPSKEDNRAAGFSFLLEYGGFAAGRYRVAPRPHWRVAEARVEGIIDARLSEILE